MYIDKKSRESSTRTVGCLKHYIDVVADCYRELLDPAGSALPLYSSIVLSPFHIPVAFSQTYKIDSEFYLRRI